MKKELLGWSGKNKIKLIDDHTFSIGKPIKNSLKVWIAINGKRKLAKENIDYKLDGKDIMLLF